MAGKLITSTIMPNKRCRKQNVLGGNTISYYCNKTTNPYKTADLEQELRKAIQNDEFVCITNQKLI